MPTTDRSKRPLLKARRRRTVTVHMNPIYVTHGSVAVDDSLSPAQSCDLARATQLVGYIWAGCNATSHRSVLDVKIHAAWDLYVVARTRCIRTLLAATKDSTTPEPRGAPVNTRTQTLSFISSKLALRHDTYKQSGTTRSALCCCCWNYPECALLAIQSYRVTAGPGWPRL